MGLFDTIKENTNLVRGGSSQPAGKFDQQIEAVEGKIRETLIQIGIVYLEKHREDCEPEYKGFIQQIKDLEEQKETLEREAFRRDPEKAYLASKEDFDKKLDELGWSPKDLKTMAVMYIDRTEYNMKRSIRLWFQELLELLFQSAALVIDTIRTFFLIALSILGPIAFALSVYDGFQSTLTQWITRYISIYMWLPVSDLFSSVLARIQVLMLTRDIEAMSDPTFIPDSSNTVYIIFLIIGIFGYFTIPTVANWIIMAGGVSQANRAMNQTANRVGNVAAAGAGAAVGNIAGKIIK